MRLRSLLLGYYLLLLHGLISKYTAHFLIQCRHLLSSHAMTQYDHLAFTPEDAASLPRLIRQHEDLQTALATQDHLLRTSSYTLRPRLLAQTQALRRQYEEVGEEVRRLREKRRVWRWIAVPEARQQAQVRNYGQHCFRALAFSNKVFGLCLY